MGLSPVADNTPQHNPVPINITPGDVSIDPVRTAFANAVPADPVPIDPAPVSPTNPIPAIDPIPGNPTPDVIADPVRTTPIHSTHASPVPTEPPLPTQSPSTPSAQRAQEPCLLTPTLSAPCLWTPPQLHLPLVLNSIAPCLTSPSPSLSNLAPNLLHSLDPPCAM